MVAFSLVVAMVLQCGIFANKALMSVLSTISKNASEALSFKR